MIVKEEGGKPVEKRKIIQAGTGSFGKSWIGIVMDSPEWELAGIVDPNRENLASASDEYGIPGEKCFASFEDAFENTSPGALLNVTPPGFHRELSIKALDAGLDVIVEKPLSDNMRDAREIVSYAEEKGRKLMVSQNYRYRSGPRTIRKLIEEGAAGEISYAVVNFQKGPRFEGFRIEMDYPLLIDMSIHHFDLMRYLTGKNPVSIYAESWNPQWSRFKGDASLNLTLQFNGDIRLSYSGSWASAGKETS